MIRFILILFFGISITAGNHASAQAKETIDFQDISFAEALAKAESSGKLVFIDCYTSWCMPCRWMEQNVFVNDSIYNFYNANFINFKIDMEKGEGVALREKYNVNSFPTYLFVDGKGNVVHRTGSKMPVSEFLKAGELAVDPLKSYQALEKRYNRGERSDSVLYFYALTLQHIDGNKYQQVKKELIDNISPETLSTPFGWLVIRDLAGTEDDKLGRYLLQHREHFEQLAGEKPVASVVNRLSSYRMYQLIRNKDEKEFFKRLKQLKADTDPTIQRDVIMFETEYYLNAHQPDSFVAVANRAMHGIMEYNDADLSFIARRALYQADGDKDVEKMALELARRAVELNPEEYSNQGTLGSICLEMGLKEEGLKAARKARELAEDATSKIQKIAQQLVDQLEAL